MSRPTDKEILTVLRSCETEFNSLSINNEGAGTKRFYKKHAEEVRNLADSIENDMSEFNVKPNLIFVDETGG